MNAVPGQPDLANSRNGIRVDLQLVADMIEPGSRVLDIGCGDGDLLAHLNQFKQADGRGIELGMDGVNACVAAGLSVIQGDADTDLTDYPDNAFDYVILSQTLQATRAPREVLSNLVRIGRRVIISIPNFGHWRVRWEIAVHGRMPINDALPYQWYETPNIHFCSLRDFVTLCDDMGVKVERSFALDHQGQVLRVRSSVYSANLFGVQGVFLLRAVEPL